MQRKPVPPAPDSLAVALSVRDAVPLVPKPEDDCCHRIVDRTDVPDRGTASAWLVFLGALGLVEETDRGFARTQSTADGSELAAAMPDERKLADAFTANVFLASEVLDALDDTDPRTPNEVFETVRGRIPRWERSKREDWPAFWTDRVERRLDWAVLLGLATETGGGYRLA